jgi:hypothetical protein
MLGKPTASLSSGLLARKGHARPAMRPQGFVQMTPSVHEDLGWNDMGDEAYPPLHQVHAAPVQVVAPAPVEAPEPVPAPPVLQQRAELEEQIAPKGEVAPEPVAELELAPEPVAEVEAEPVSAPVLAAKPRPVVTTGTLARVVREVKTSKT